MLGNGGGASSCLRMRRSACSVERVSLAPPLPMLPVADLSLSPLISSGKSETMSPLWARASTVCDAPGAANLYIALAVFHVHNVGASHVEFHAAVVVDNLGVAVDLAHLDVLRTGQNHPHRPDNLGGVDGIAVQRHVAWKPRKFQIGARGVEVNRLVDSFQMRVAGVVALQRDFSVNVGDGEVAAVAFDRNVALDVVRGEISMIGKMGVDMALNRGGLHVAVLNLRVDVAAKTGDGEAAVAGGDVDGGGAGHGQHQVGAPAGVAVDLDDHGIPLTVTWACCEAKIFCASASVLAKATWCALTLTLASSPAVMLMSPRGFRSQSARWQGFWCSARPGRSHAAVGRGN